jgi:hypothetical protein
MQNLFLANRSSLTNTVKKPKVNFIFQIKLLVSMAFG